jgi:hypothetical protein
MIVDRVSLDSIGAHAARIASRDGRELRLALLQILCLLDA